jgi:7-cyano-7-deazaguanine tRNA-ribosyltransferase
MSESDSETPAAGRPGRLLRTTDGRTYALPMFLPVYQRNRPLVSLDRWKRDCSVEGCIVNAYFLYKNRQLRTAFRQGLTLRDYTGTEGLLMTDSGAFQGFTRPLLLSNVKIVKFQEQIAADVASPLDLVTPPGDGRKVAERKLQVTLQRVREAREHVSTSILAGVQQGGRFMDLRQESLEGLMDCGVEYVALGSLVPFFTRNHNLEFVGRVLREARKVVGPERPLHVFGAGDPVEVPFLAACGADVFDSSSYAHYARGGYYMTPYGAVQMGQETFPPHPNPLPPGEREQVSPLPPGKKEIVCGCPVCRDADGPSKVSEDVAGLALHNLWTITDTMRRVREAMAADRLEAMLDEVLRRHTQWFPESALQESWDALENG